MTQKYGSTARVQKLRDDIRSLKHAKHRDYKELTVLKDEGLKNKALIVRKAHAFRLILEEMPLYIEKGELIVGGRTLLGENPEKKSQGQFAEGSEYHLFFYPSYAREEEKKNAAKISENMLNSLVEGRSTSHSAAGFQRVLKLGFGGIKNFAKKMLLEEDEEKKIDFYQAVIIITDSIIDFIKRYEILAFKLARKEIDEKRKKELVTIANNCAIISSSPPENYWQSLQLFFFTHLFTQIEHMTMMSLGRFDQYICPYLEKDLNEGNITREKAQELLECLWIKFNDTADISTDNGMHTTLSGLGEDGKDATNQLSYMCIDATMNLQIVDPKINVRLHNKTPDKFMEKCCELAKLGMGYPAIFNDETIIPSLEKYGVASEDAREYCTDGCSEVMIPGKSDFYPVHGAVMLLDPLMHTLEKLGSFNNFNEFFMDLKDEIRKAINIRFERVRRWEPALADISPMPYLSATLEGCLEKGLDKTLGGTIYNHTGAIGSGFVNTVNSLMAVKEIIFDRKLLDQEEFKEVLKNNYQGEEELRQTLLGLDRKFGNDIDSVDQIAVELAEYFSTEVLKHENSRGGRFLPGFFQYQYVIEGNRIKATPDGRRSGDPLANNLAPYPGTGNNGPTSAIKSATKLDHLLCPLGTSLDIKISASSLQGKEGSGKLAALMMSFIQLGGMQLQLNTVSAKILRDARANPDKYRDLVVRVWGFNAYFVSLTDEYQNYIIQRLSSNL